MYMHIFLCMYTYKIVTCVYNLLIGPCQFLCIIFLCRQYIYFKINHHKKHDAKFELVCSTVVLYAGQVCYYGFIHFKATSLAPYI